jgi:hypothetical protein
MKRIFVVFLCICALLVTACSSEKDQTFRVGETAVILTVPTGWSQTASAGKTLTLASDTMTLTAEVGAKAEWLTDGKTSWQLFGEQNEAFLADHTNLQNITNETTATKLTTVVHSRILEAEKDGKAVAYYLATVELQGSEYLIRVVVTAEPSVMRRDYKQIERILLDLKTEA